jgi:hypothetical protein
MDYSTAYVIGSIAVGLLQVVDNVLLARSKRRVTTAGAFLTTVEFAWVIVSAISLISLNNVPRFLPLSFIAFSVIGWIYGVYLLRSIKIEDGEIILKDFVIAPWYCVFGGAFGVYFAIFSFLVHQSMFA